MRIVFVRHGHPDYVHDCLTPLGHQHAAAAAERLRGEGITQIFSSTCGRALETAAHTAELLSLPVERCDFMREITWGTAEGAPLYANGHPWDTADRMVAEGASLLEMDWMQQEPFLRNKLISCMEQLYAAADSWMADLGYIREGLYYRVKGNTNRTVAAFGHGGASTAILSRLFNLPFPFVCTAMGPDYTGITIVTLPDTENALVIPRFELLGDAQHIRGLRTENIYGN